MELLLLFFVAILGAILGSFINALSFRFNTGRTMWGRSRCMHCRHELSAEDLIPIFSYVFLLGKCRYCHSKISFQYPLVEFAAAVISVLTYIAHPEPSEYLFWLLVWMVFLFTVVYDIKHTIIPWSCSIFLIVLSLLNLFANDFTLYDLVAGPILALPLFMISLLSLGKWMGWADSVLELSVGWFLGLSAGFSALLIAFWSGAIVGSALMLRKNRYTMRSEIPFAPFLVFGAAVAHFFHVDFFTQIFW